MRAPTTTEPRQWCREVLAVRVKLGWTQQRLADELGVSRWSVMRWEKGTQEIPTLALRQIRDWLENQVA